MAKGIYLGASFDPNDLLNFEDMFEITQMDNHFQILSQNKRTYTIYGYYQDSENPNSQYQSVNFELIAKKDNISLLLNYLMMQAYEFFIRITRNDGKEEFFSLYLDNNGLPDYIELNQNDKISFELLIEGPRPSECKINLTSSFIFSDTQPNTACKIKKAYIGVNNYAKEIKKIYIGVNDIARLIMDNENANDFYYKNLRIEQINLNKNDFIKALCFNEHYNENFYISIELENSTETPILNYQNNYRTILQPNEIIKNILFYYNNNLTYTISGEPNVEIVDFSPSNLIIHNYSCVEDLDARDTQYKHTLHLETFFGLSKNSYIFPYFLWESPYGGYYGHFKNPNANEPFYTDPPLLSFYTDFEITSNSKQMSIGMNEEELIDFCPHRAEGFFNHRYGDILPLLGAAEYNIPLYSWSYGIEGIELNEKIIYKDPCWLQYTINDEFVKKFEAGCEMKNLGKENIYFEFKVTDYPELLETVEL